MKIDDGALRIFINTKGQNREEFSQEFLDFMDYINESTEQVAARTQSKRIKLIHRNVEQIRESEKLGVKYMQLWEEKVYERLEGREEGREEGRVQGGNYKLISQVVKKLEKKKEEEVIAEELEESPRTIRQICDAAGKYAPKYDIEKIYQDVYGKTEEEKNKELR